VSDDNQKGPVDRALDVFVFAPLGLALLARDTVPGLLQTFAARGRAEVDSRRTEAQSKVEQARAMGRFAVDYGAPKVRKRVEQHLGDARARAEQGITGLVVPREGGPPVVTEPVVTEPVVTEPVVTEPAAPAANAAPSAERESSETASATANGAGNVASAAERPRAALSIPDYDELSASQVVQRLPGLTRDELEAIRAYETHGRGRRTILGKIDQLAH
jgi:hypothetical protein